MSLKLHITIDGKEISVYPTPTHITHMCMTTELGWAVRLKGRKAKRAIHSYIVWAYHQNPDDKLKDLYKAIKSGKEFEVYAQ